MGVGENDFPQRRPKIDEGGEKKGREGRKIEKWAEGIEFPRFGELSVGNGAKRSRQAATGTEIGRASCRERV